MHIEWVFRRPDKIIFLLKISDFSRRSFRKLTDISLDKSSTEAFSDKKEKV